MILEDSYWFVDARLPEQQQKISVMCVNCYKKKKIGWFWEGTKHGYKKELIKCSLCDKIIYQEIKNEK
jgi:hypothetical protein